MSTKFIGIVEKADVSDGNVQHWLTSADSASSPDQFNNFKSIIPQRKRFTLFIHFISTLPCTIRNIYRQRQSFEERNQKKRKIHVIMLYSVIQMQVILLRWLLNKTRFLFIVFWRMLRKDIEKMCWLVRQSADLFLNWLAQSVLLASILLFLPLLCVGKQTQMVWPLYQLTYPVTFTNGSYSLWVW